MKKRIFVFSLISLLAATCFTALFPASVFAAENQSYESYALSVLEVLSPDESFTVTNKEPIYDLDDNLYGFKVNFKNTETQVPGYINLSAEGNIHEYSFAAEETVFGPNTDRIYYDGSISYFFRKGADAYFSTSDGRKFTRSQLGNRSVTGHGGGYNATGQVIYNPRSFVTNFVNDEGRIEIDGFHLPSQYLIMDTYASQLGYREHCGLTAIMNLLLYWDNNGYPNLLTSASPYLTEIQSIESQIGHYNLSYASVRNGLETFMKQKYPDSFNYFNDLWITHSDIKSRVLEGDPFIYLVNGNSHYGNHFVVGLGYQILECWYKNIFGVTCYEDVMFILIADGHSALPNRYICFNDASLRIMVVAQEK